MWLIALDDFFFEDHGIPPAMLTNKSSYLGFGVDRRSGMSSSVFFGASPEPASWHVVIELPTEDARYALIALLSAQRRSQFRLLAQRELYSDDLVTVDAAATSIDQSSFGAFLVTFESNDSVWLSEIVDTVSKTFTSPLDQGMYLPVRGNLPTSPVVRITPTAQRATTTAAVGWKYRRRYAVTNAGDEPLFRYPVRIDLGNTATLVSGGKARTDGADLRVWLHGLEQSRSVMLWNTTASYVWVVIPVLPAGQSLTFEIVYGNPLATAADGVDLAYPDKPAFDMTASSNNLWTYRTAQNVSYAGQGLWYLSSPLEGGSADYGVPGAWQPALTYENTTNSDDYAQPRAQRLAASNQQWYQSRLYASRWHGPGFAGFAEYAGSSPADGVTIHNPFGVRSVHAVGVSLHNDSYVKTVVTTTVGSTTASTEVLTPHDPPYTRSVVIGRNGGGEGWHVLKEYGGTINPELPPGATSAVTGGRLYMPSSGAPEISPTYASGWETTGFAIRVATSRSRINSATDSPPPLYGYSITNEDSLAAQFIYPLSVGVVFSTAQTVKGQMVTAESDAAADARSQTVIRVMTATSVVRATLLDFDTAALSSEFFVAPGGQSRKFPRGGAVALQANYTSVAGDYLVIEVGVRFHTATYAGASFLFGDVNETLLPENETETNLNLTPWIEFSGGLDPAVVPTTAPTIAYDWTPPSPVKHFGVACWPYGGSKIPDDVESRASIEVDGDISINLAAELLYVTPTETEVQIYELATELRVHGGANAIAPYDALVIGNARKGSGPGTPRASLILASQGIEVDTERRTHALWNTAFDTQGEIISAHAVQAFVGTLREIDATDVAGMVRIPQTITNADFAANLTNWESHLGNGGWTYAVTRDAAYGGTMKFALTTTTAATILWRNMTYFPLQTSDAVEVTAWMRQAEAGSAEGRIGVAWYNASSTLLSESFDVFSGFTLPVATDNTLVFSGSPPATATQFRILVGVTAFANAPGTKWFDNITATIVRPLRYSGASPKVTDEVRASQWLPIAPPQRTVANGGFDADLSSWELLDAGTGITHTTTYDGTIGGEQVGSLKIAITANTGVSAVTYANTQFHTLNGQERVEVSCWARTSNANLHPHIEIDWYDANGAFFGYDTETAWAANPTVNTGYTRMFAMVAPPNATKFRIALTAEAVVATTVGNVWFDDVRINDNMLVVGDVSAGTLGVTARVRPRWVP